MMALVTEPNACSMERFKIRFKSKYSLVGAVLVSAASLFAACTGLNRLQVHYGGPAFEIKSTTTWSQTLQTNDSSWPGTKLAPSTSSINP